MAATASICGLLARRLGASEQFFAENGPVELLQAGILMAVLVVFLRALKRSSDGRALFCLGVVYVLFLAIVREIPRCDSTSYLGGMCLSGAGKSGLSIAASVVGLVALAGLPIAWKAALHPSNLRWIWPMALIAGIVAVGEVAESADFAEIEEFLELAAYIGLGFFGAQILWRARSQDRC